jgi:hypothetical protein
MIMTPRFVIRFPNGSLLKKFLLSDSLTTSELSAAKLFQDEMKCRALAGLLSGQIDQVEVCLDLDPALSSEGEFMTDFEKVLTVLCEQAGGIFQGLQTGHQRHAALILFTDASAPKDQQSTLALPIFECSTDSIRQRLAEIRQKFAPKSLEATA